MLPVTIWTNRNRMEKENSRSSVQC